MNTREGKDTVYFQERRKEASKKVKLQFVDEEFKKFNVLDDSGNVKYLGKIDLEKSIDDDCSCPSFEYGMQYEKLDEIGKKGKSLYLEYNGTAFQCKHIIRAKSMRMIGLMEEYL